MVHLDLTPHCQSSLYITILILRTFGGYIIFAILTCCGMSAHNLNTQEAGFLWLHDQALSQKINLCANAMSMDKKSSLQAST